MNTLIRASLDDMLFENRERQYGAHSLRRAYPRHLLLATFLVLLLFTAYASYPFLSRALGWSKAEAQTATTAVMLSLTKLPPPPAMDPELPPPTPPPRIPPPQVRQIGFPIPEPTPADQLDEDDDQQIATIEELTHAPSIGLTHQDGVDSSIFTGEIGEGAVPEVIVNPDPGIGDFVSGVSQEPSPVNIKDIRQLIGYPTMAQDAGIEGTVIMRVLVDKRGKYKRHRVINESHPLLTEAVEKHLSKLKFTPAIQGDRAISFWVNIPFKFSLIK